MKNQNKTYENKSSNSKNSASKSENENYIKSMTIEAVGYPFNFSLMENFLEIRDKKLFEEYSKDQWLGTEVKKGSYLFDQKIIPDFGFKVIDIDPDEGIISENTKINIINEEYPSNNETKPIKTNFKLSDVVGQENAKNKIKVLMKYLEEPEIFGQWAPKNILFYGLPGTGKTMLVKAIANELKVPLYLVKATSLIGDHVGDGASNIHELYEKAQKNTPAIIFIDEIDAIALHRNYQSLRGDVAEIVNALLTEMDGIDENKGVVSIAATNNPNFIDHAVRSRFEQEIEFKMPNDSERKEIIQNNLKSYPLKNNFDLDKLVHLTKNMSGRDIKEKILKTALHHGISLDKDTITMKDIDFALNENKIKKSEVKGMHE